jgi:hypothetical protein
MTMSPTIPVVAICQKSFQLYKLNTVEEPNEQF